MGGAEQQKRSEKLRQSIIDQAFKIGIQEGFDELSVRKITKKMRYSTGVIYHHFKNKQEIIDAIVATETARLNALITDLLDERKDIVSNMRTVFHRIMILAREEPEKYNLVVLRKYSTPQSQRPQWIDHLSQEFEKGVREGLLRAVDPGQIAFAIWSSFLGFNLMISRSTHLTPAQAEEMFDVQFGLILKGVLKHE